MIEQIERSEQPVRVRSILEQQELPMTRPLLASALILAAAIATPASATTPTADAARLLAGRVSPTTQPIRAALRPTTLRKSRYDLSRMMARNFGTIGQRQLDTLVASVM
jgi:hypothetical protein